MQGANHVQISCKSMQISVPKSIECDSLQIMPLGLQVSVILTMFLEACGLQ